MPQTAIISPQIIDSTSIGRDLITAADQAAAQAIIGVTGVDTGADYTWTGDHTFDGSVTLDNAEWSNSNGVLNQPDINGFHYFAFAGSNVFRASALDFIPMSNGTKALGRSDLRFSDVLSVDGDFSGTLSAVTVAGQTNNLTLQSNSGSALISLAEGGSVSLTAYSSIYQQFTNIGVGYRKNCYPLFATLDLGSAATPWNNGYFNNLSSAVGGSYKLYNLGQEGDADTEYLEMTSSGTSYSITTNATGSGTARSFTVGSGNAGATFNEVGQQLLLYGGGSLKADILAGGIRLWDDIYPQNTGALECGTATNRWSNLYSVAGSFSGTITNTATTGWSATFDRGIRVGADSGVNWFFGDGNNTKFNTAVYFEKTFTFARPADGITSRVYRIQKEASTFNLKPVDSGVSGDIIFQVEDATDTFQPLRTGGIVSHYPANSGSQAYRMYNLGEDGDADTEYLELSWAANKAYLVATETGTGIARDLVIGSGSSVRVAYNGNERILFSNTEVRPVIDNYTSLGSVTRQYSDVFSVDGSFSGNMTLSNLPTSDPAAAGQLWNDSGTVKISAG